MRWTDDGIVLSVRKHGETSVIVSLLTRGHGRSAGLVRGGAGRRARGILQTGNLLTAAWNARLSEHLGAFSCEMIKAYSAALLDTAEPLMALGTAAALIDIVLPEREPHPGLFDGTIALLEALDTPEWDSAYVRWEVALLTELGFGLDLLTCAATGTADDLVYVSPRTGRAVSRAAGAPYRDRLLALPQFLTEPDGRGIEAAEIPAPSRRDIVTGLRLTGYFLETHVLPNIEARMPDSRVRLLDRLSRSSQGG